MTPLILAIAGRYTTTWDPVGVGPAVNVGICTDDGYELAMQVHGEEVKGTDAFAQTLLDGIYQGADFRLRYTSMEYKDALMEVFWPWGAGTNKIDFRLGTIGRRYSEVAGQLIMTATAGTPAAASPATLTAEGAIVSPNTNLSTNFTSKTRLVPIEQVLLPYDDGGGNVIWWSTT